MRRIYFGLVQYEQSVKDEPTRVYNFFYSGLYESEAEALDRFREGAEEDAAEAGLTGAPFGRVAYMIDDEMIREAHAELTSEAEIAARIVAGEADAPEE